MKHSKTLILLFLNILLLSHCYAEEKKHLIIMTGQSNMGRLDPSISFKPIVRDALKNDEVTFIKKAWGGRNIDKWYPNGALYSKIMVDIKETMESNKFDTITLVWMQGEADSQKAETANAYKSNVLGLIKQFSIDLKRPDLKVVIGRINDAREKEGQDPERKDNWLKIKTAQVDAANEYKFAEWINTDDLNEDGGVHNTDEGYKKMGIRFACKTVKLITGKELVIDEQSFKAHKPDGKDTYMAQKNGNGGQKKKGKGKKK